MFGPSFCTLIAGIFAFVGTKSSPLVTLTPSKTLVQEYESVTLTCSSVPAVDVIFCTWYSSETANEMMVEVSGETCKPNFPLNGTSLYLLNCKERGKVILTLQNISGCQHNIKWNCKINYLNMSNTTTIHVDVPIRSVNLSEYGTVTLKENTTFHLNCTTSPSRPPGKITWRLLKNDEEIPFEGFNITRNVTFNSACSSSSDNLTIVWNELTVILHRSNNNNTLFCSAGTYENNLDSSGKIVFNISYPPDPPQIKNNTGNGVYRMLENTATTFLCSVYGGNPRPVLDWTCFKRSVVTFYDNDTAISLVTVNASRDDNTITCTCTSTQMLDNNTASLKVDILYPPGQPSLRFIGRDGLNETISKVVHAVKGDSFDIKCSATSKPGPDVKWDDLTPIVIDPSILKVDAITKDSTRTCVATNTMTETSGRVTHGIRNISLEIVVLVPPEIPEVHVNEKKIPPNEININVIENTTLTLSCITFSKPPPVYQWSKNDKLQNFSDTLEIFAPKRNEDSSFECQVINLMQRIPGLSQTGNTSRTIQLHVLFPPGQPALRFIGRDGLNETISKVVHAVKGDSFDIKCSATSKPNPVVKWDDSTTMDLDTSVLNVVAITNDSNRTCIAMNTMNETNGRVLQGIGNTSLEIVVLVPPEFPDLFVNEKKIPSNTITINVIENTTLALRCQTFSKPPPVYKWTKYGTLQNNSNTLLIVASKRNVDSSAECHVSTLMERIPGRSDLVSYSRNIHLNVLYPPDKPVLTFIGHDGMNETITNVVAVIGDSFEVKCSSISNPDPDVRWNSSTTASAQPSVLKIETVTNDMIRTCYATNTMNETQGNVTIGFGNISLAISVLNPPSFPDIHANGQKLSKEDLIVRVIENTTLTLRCETSSRPPPLYKWIKNNGLFNNSDILLINSPKRKEDESYRCNVSNIMKRIPGKSENSMLSRDIRLDVLYRAEISEFFIKDRKMEDGDKIRANESDSIMFICRAEGNPEAIVELKKDLKSLNTTVKQSLEYILQNSSCKDTGTYTCFGNNTLLGEQAYQSRKIRLFVNCSPRQSAEVQQNVTVSQHGSAKLRFLAMAYPIPDITWRRYINSELILASNGNITTSYISENEIEIVFILPSVTMADYGEYIVTVKNIFGSHEQSFFLINTDPTSAEPNTRDDSNAGAIAGGVIGSIICIVAVVATIFIARKRGLFWKTKDDEEHRVYQNVGFKGELKQSKRLPALPPDDESEDVHGDHRTIAQHQQQQDFDTDEHPYLNTMELIDLMKKVNVSDLFSYVNSKSYQEFSDEFGKFPSGLMVSIPCTTASKPQNAPLNRYQGIYPYDHSRVIISGQPDFFINASYIDGHSGEQEYIASLGPTVKHTLGFRTFWNMVWHERSDVIVMLTNLQEPSGMKCEKYWADRGTTRNIGDFTIQSMGEEVAADYKVRTFKVFKDDESRLITQLHFTAWPDKKVPEDVTSLIEFRQRVKAAPTRSVGPLIVHCSAGVGRTGTYIALDRLIEEGKSKNAINVYDCVMNMRKQRVNMVQTLDQYVYLHQALVYCLVFDIEPVSSRGIDEYVKKTSNNVYSKLFQQLQQTVEDETIEEKEARARNGDMLEKNRKTSDIPSDAHRIRLFLDKQMGESDYINAVYLNGFKRLGHFIIAQSPLPTTLDDFVCLLYQANCCCIVSLDDYTQTGASNVTYLPPDNQPMKYGTFTISCSNLDVKSGYSVRKLNLGHTGQFEKGERIVYHFEFAGWKQDDRTPKDPKLFVDFVKDVDKYATQLEDENSHVLVHCMSGSERSGLFCAVYNLMDKMEQERQVSVVNMLRRVRARRRTAIPNMEQLKFCYQALNAFVKSYKI